MKRTAFLALAAALTAVVYAQPYTPPFDETFDNGLGEFTEYDANNDGNKIKYQGTYGGYNYTNGVYYTGTEETGADDWLFTPALSLKAGMVYELTYFYKTSSSNTVNKVEWKAGTSPEVSAMTISCGEPAEYEYTFNSFVKESIMISVPSDGDYNLGMHLFSDAGQGTFYFDEFSIASGLNASMPEAPEVSDIVFTVSGDQLHASFNITPPTRNISGESLGTSPVTLRISRSDLDTPVTLTASPGEPQSYTDEDASLQSVTYTVTCVSESVEGVPVSVTSSPRIGTPKKVEGFNAVRNGNEFTLSWNAVTEATNSTDMFIPGKVRYTVKCGSETVADNTAQTTATYAPEMPAEGQKAITFTVTALLGSKQSETYTSPTYLIGETLNGEFKESFANYSYTNSGWTVENNVTNAWQPSVGNSYPAIDPQDNDNGCLSFGHTSGQVLRIYSPLLNLSGLANPRLKFWVYLQPGSYYIPSVQPGFITESEELTLGEPIALNSGDTEGWTEFSYDLPAMALSGTTQLFFTGVGDGSYGKIYIDNITILSYLDHNLALMAEPPAKQFGIGEQVIFPITILNKGANLETDYTVTLFADEEQVAEVEGVDVAPSGTVVLELPFTAYPKYAGNDVTFQAVLNMDADMDATDNAIEMTIPVVTNELAVITGLTAEATQQSINLSWNAPEVSSDPVIEEVTESFETWENGATEAKDGWVFIDVDGIAQEGLNDINSNSMFSAMVIENFTGNYSWDPSITAHDGVKCLAMTPSYSYGGTLDNWIISPTINGGTELSFYTKTAYNYSATNNVDILWSTGGTAPEDFTVLDTKTVPNGDWMECSYELPADARRFAIHYNGSLRGDALVFDTFRFTGMTDPAVHTGYNLYRDHELVTTLSVEDTLYTDVNVSDGVTYTYHVTALYDKGESAYSEAVTCTKKTVSGVTDIEQSNDDAEIQYYNLQGMRISTPAKGAVVIVRKGTECYKAVIK